MITATIVPVTDSTTVDELARVAKAAGLYLIRDGHTVVVSPVVLAGFVKIAVKVKCPQRAHLEAIPCAA